MKFHTHNLLRFLAYVRPYWFLLVLGTVGGIIKFTIPLIPPQITRYIIDDLFPNALLDPAEKATLLFHLLGGMGLLYLLVYIPGTFCRHYYSARAGHRAVFDLRCDLYYKILRMSSSFFDRHRSGSIVSRLISDIELAQNLIGTALTNVWMDAMALGLVLFFMIRIDPTLTVVALVTFPFYLVAFRHLGHHIRRTSHEVQDGIANLSGNVTEKISGSRIVHAFAQECREKKRFEGDTQHLFSTSMRRILYQSLNMVITGFLTGLAPLLVIAYGGYLVIHDELRVGELIAIMMYLGPLYLPLQRFSELNVVLANSMAAVDRIFEVMDMVPEIKNHPDAVAIDTLSGEVVFDHVTFAYGEAGPVLRDICFTARPGQKIAIVGPSGSGKSTFAGLIPRFYDPTEGRILLDGEDVRRIRLQSLRKHIGMVLQDAVLFSGTIRDNIRYGRPKASVEEVAHACREANAYDFIRDLPDGVDTEVGERGDLLSGGQKQRITIARAFLKDPKILILDEATSALDAESERLLQEALDRLMEGRTTFLIAHRLSTIRTADVILVLDKGRIVEQGNHEELIRLDGLYAQLCRQQFKTDPALADPDLA